MLDRVTRIPYCDESSTTTRLIKFDPRQFRWSPNDEDIITFLNRLFKMYQQENYSVAAMHDFFL